MNLEYNVVQFYFSRSFYLARQPQWPMASSFTRLLDQTHNAGSQSVGSFWN